MFAAVYASHLLVDALTIDARGPAGAQFFWPLSDGYYISPVTVFHEIIIDGDSRAGFLRTVLAWRTVVVLVREMVIATAMVAGVHLLWPWLRGEKVRDLEVAVADRAHDLDLGLARSEEDLA